MERLAKGASCHPLPSSHPLCPTCMDPDNYAPAFWPAELTRRNQYPVGSGFDAASAPGGMNETRGLRGGGNDGGRGSVPEGTGSGGSFRVIVATEDAGVERMLEKYDVSASMIFYASRRLRLLFIVNGLTSRVDTGDGGEIGNRVGCVRAVVRVDLRVDVPVDVPVGDGHVASITFGSVYIPEVALRIFVRATLCSAMSWDLWQSREVRLVWWRWPTLSGSA